ncbi:MAG: APC family permease [Acidimicrobiales bacterium]
MSEHGAGVAEVLVEGEPPGENPGEKGLKQGALGLVASLVIGVASTAPAYSLAASLGFVTLSVGIYAPAVLLLAFVPMLFIAAAYYFLNRSDPDCGTTFAWVSRALGPKTGWMAGWGIIVTDLVVMPSLAGIAGKYTFLLFNADGLANSRVWSTVLGVVWIVVMTVICYIGIELSARTQVALLGAELVMLSVFAVVALVHIGRGHVPHELHPGWSWLNPAGPSLSALSAGLLTAVFIYWGWDTAVSVNEESRDITRIPGVAAVLSTLVLLAIYLVVSIAAQGFHGPGYLSNNASDVLNALARDVLGSPWNKLLVIAVLTSASASTQTTILPAARSALSMAVHRAIPESFGHVNRRHLTPGVATIVFGAVSVAWYVTLTAISTDVLGNSILALGFGIAFYYAMTGYACVVYYRRLVFKSVKNFFLIGVAPLLGAVMLSAIFVDALFYYSNPANSNNGRTAWLGFVHFDVHVLGVHLHAKGLGPPVVIGIGLLLIGVPLMVAWRIRHAEFFRRARHTAHSLEALAPPLTPGAAASTT